MAARLDAFLVALFRLTRDFSGDPHPFREKDRQNSVNKKADKRNGNGSNNYQDLRFHNDLHFQNRNRLNLDERGLKSKGRGSVTFSLHKFYLKFQAFDSSLAQAFKGLIGYRGLDRHIGRAVLYFDLSYMGGAEAAGFPGQRSQNIAGP